MNGDSLINPNIREFIAWHEERKCEASMILTKEEDTGRYGRVRVAPNGLVKGFEGKLPSAGPGLINAGVYLCARSTLEAIPIEKSFSLESELFPLLVHRRSLFGFVDDALFLDIGIPESFASAENFMSKIGLCSSYI